MANVRSRKAEEYLANGRYGTGDEYHHGICDSVYRDAKWLKVPILLVVQSCVAKRGRFEASE